MNDKAPFSRRLRQAMQAAGYPPQGAVLEREFNQRYLGKSVSLQAVCRWLRGEAIPTQDKLMVLAEWLGVDWQALRYGEQATLRVSDQQGEWRVKGKTLSAAEQDTVEAFLALPASQKKIVREVIQAFTRGNAK